MQPDDPSITAVSTAASAAAFTIFLVAFVLMGHTFLLVDKPWQLGTAVSDAIPVVRHVCNVAQNRRSAPAHVGGLGRANWHPTQERLVNAGGTRKVLGGPEQAGFGGRARSPRQFFGRCSQKAAEVVRPSGDGDNIRALAISASTCE
jgi:hypothetical protein